MKPAYLVHGIMIGVAALLSLPATTFAADKAVIRAMEEYFDAAEYESASAEGYLDFAEDKGADILQEQIPAEDWKNIHVIDVRNADQYQNAHIPGAVNIEWRKVLKHRTELPGNKMVLLYCNDGTLSSQAGLALRVAGMGNVRILQGGFSEWKAKGGFKANKVASEKSGQ